MGAVRKVVREDWVCGVLRGWERRERTEGTEPWVVRRRSRSVEGGMEGCTEERRASFRSVVSSSSGGGEVVRRRLWGGGIGGE